MRHPLVTIIRTASTLIQWVIRTTRGWILTQPAACACCTAAIDSLALRCRLPLVGPLARTLRPRSLRGFHGSCKPARSLRIVEAARAAQLGDALPQLPLLHLSERALGEALHEHHAPRMFEAREAAVEQLQHALFVDLGAGPLHHRRDDGLAPICVGDADHCGLRDLGAISEDALELRRIDVLAARHD